MDPVEKSMSESLISSWIRSSLETHKNLRIRDTIWSACDIWTTPTCYTGQPFEEFLCENNILGQTWNILCTSWWLNIFVYNCFNLRRQIFYFRLFVKIVKPIMVISYVLSAAPLTVKSIMVLVNHSAMEKSIICFYKAKTTSFFCSSIQAFPVCPSFWKLLRDWNSICCIKQIYSCSERNIFACKIRKHEVSECWLTDLNS